MDWKLSIKRNREALAVIIAALIAMIGQRDTLPRPVRHSILRILRPAESALRRLIVIVAATRTMSMPKAIGPEVGASLPDFSTFADRKTLPAFVLTDPRRRFGVLRQRSGANLGIPRISVPGFTEPAPTASTCNDEANAAAILRRIATLDHALKTLPRQARRLIRLTARRTKTSSGSFGPLRRGSPPGWRRRPVRDVDDVLHECHGLALDCGFKPP